MLRLLTTTLPVPARTVGVPTVRRSTGLVLFKTPTTVRQSEAVPALRRAGLDVLARESGPSLDDLDVVNARLQALEVVQNTVRDRVLVAARLWGVRPTDNAPLDPDAV